MSAGNNSVQAAPRSVVLKYLPPALLALGAVIFIVAFVVADTDDDPSLTVSGNPAIEELIPAPGAEVLRQSQVGVDLAPGFDAELVINDVPIPRDQVNVLRAEDDPEESAESAAAFDTSLSLFLYQPLEGRAVPELKGDENCAVATFWPVAEPTAIETIRWCFTVA